MKQLHFNSWQASSLFCLAATVFVVASYSNRDGIRVRPPVSFCASHVFVQDVQTLKEASTTSSEKSLEDREPEGGKPNKTQQLKKVFKEYGAVGVSFHIGISLMSLGMFYMLVSR